MLTWFRAVNFGCLKDVQTDLMPLHAFIGPNDSGKSTLLRAIREYLTKPRWHDARFKEDTVPVVKVEASFDLTDPQRPDRRDPKTQIKVKRYAALNTPYTELLTGKRTPADEPEAAPTRFDPDAPPRNEERAAALVRFDPDALRRSSGLIPEHQQIDFLDDRGAGLPGIYDAILSRGDDSFAKIAGQVRQLFPSVKALRLKAVSSSAKSLEIELTDGTRVEAGQFSEGLLYYLAFAALPCIALVPLVLIEEPENGLHPARIAEVMRMLRQITEHGRTQVLLATHSPLVLNELRPEEVTVVTRSPSEGTRLMPMIDTKNFAERAKIYALGELWLSYANGTDESGLVGSEA